MQPYKEQKMEELLKHLAAEFIQRESNRTSLITVTAVTMTNKLTHAHILLTVLPEEREEQAVEFLNRNKGEFMKYVKNHAKISRLPSVEFAIDFGEKNRQRIDELSNQNQSSTEEQTA